MHAIAAALRRVQKCARMKLPLHLLLPVAGAALLTVSVAQDETPKVTAAEALKLV
jgi:hypothetical protein